MVNKRRAVVVNEYVPEYKRLGVKPIEYPVKDPEEFAKYKRKVLAEKQQIDKNKGFLALRQAYKEGRLSKEELESIIGKVQEDAVVEEKRVKYLSGQETEQQWTKALVNKEEEEEIKVNKKQFYYDDVELPPELEKAPAMAAVEDDEDEEVESEFSLESLPVGEYVLLHNSAVLKYGSKKDLLEELSTLLDDDQAIDFDKGELVLLKRISINYGINIDD